MAISEWMVNAKDQGAARRGGGGAYLDEGQSLTALIPVHYRLHEVSIGPIIELYFAGKGHGPMREGAIGAEEVLVVAIEEAPVGKVVILSEPTRCA